MPVGMVCERRLNKICTCGSTVIYKVRARINMKSFLKFSNQKTRTQGRRASIINQSKNLFIYIFISGTKRFGIHAIRLSGWKRQKSYQQYVFLVNIKLRIDLDKFISPSVQLFGCVFHYCRLQTKTNIWASKILV